MDAAARIEQLEAEVRRLLDQGGEAQAVIAALRSDVESRNRALAEALEQQAATAEVLRVITSSPTDLDTVLQAIIDAAARLCEAEGILFQRRERDGMLAARVGHGRIREIQEALRRAGRDSFDASHGVSISRRSINGRAFLDGRVVAVDDVLDQDEFPEARESYERYRDRAHSDNQGPNSPYFVLYRSQLSVPMLRRGEPIGVLGMGRTEVRPFAEREVALLQSFANQAVIAIENARLFQELADLNRTLEARVREQVGELERVGRLRRYLSPQLADLIVSSGDESILESHRRQIAVVFCDLRGFTAFAETAEPEEVMGVLDEYHAVMGDQVRRFEGTLDHFAGDGLMVFFNDPLPQHDHAERAVRMACAMRDRAGDLAREWRRAGHELDFGVGIAVGYATLGRIGFEGRYDYTAIGTVANLAARLCGEAAGGQILIPARLHGMVESLIEAEPAGELALKGFHRPVQALNITRLRDGESTDADVAT